MEREINKVPNTAVLGCGNEYWSRSLVWTAETPKQMSLNTL
jgi:hypothetical protein